MTNWLGSFRLPSGGLLVSLPVARLGAGCIFGPHVRGLHGMLDVHFGAYFADTEQDPLAHGRVCCATPMRLSLLSPRPSEIFQSQ